MCGLVGVAGQVGLKQENILKQLLIVDSLRGTDSTGIATIGKNTNLVKVAKQVGNPFELFADKRYDAAMQGAHKAIIGHNRYGTSGAITRANAHPFDLDKVVGVHNGTLHNKHELLDSHLFKVDSENLYYHIQEEGLKDAIGKARGAWALVWWDKEECTLNFLRNKERPLAMVTDTDGKALYWASEGWMLQGVLGREGIKHESIWSLAEDTHLSFEIDKDGVIGKPHAAEVKGGVFQQPTPVKGKTGTDSTTSTTTSTQVSTGTSPRRNGTEITYLDPRNKPADKYAEYTKFHNKEYLQSKKVLFESLTRCRDNSGNDYVMLFDQNNPEYAIRMYCNSSASNFVMANVGCNLYADISHFCGDEFGGYYKVDPRSVQTLSKEATEELMDDELSLADLIINTDGKIERKKYISKSGVELSREDYALLYHHCECCDTVLNPDEDNRFTAGGNVICPACVVEFQNDVTLI